MLFNSFEFLLFFPIVTILYFLLPFKGKLTWLLIASCFFYMFFKPEYIVILGFTIVVDYYAGILLEREQDPKKKKRYLIMSLVANIGVLAAFKYYNFFNENVTGLVTLFGYKNPIPFLRIALPIGLSFHTFQAMSYTIEVYRGNYKAERNFRTYALYVMFYPQLVAGPIERPQNILYQFHVNHKFEYPNLVLGLRLILWGLVKKCLIADRLALFVDPVYQNPTQYSSIVTFTALVFFAIQIYCDFSGYSDIALGTARVMGYKLMTNFNRPYLSSNIVEFWQRWHISLSTWLRDYLYIPLGGSRVGKVRSLVNVLIVFAVSGIWHGASWNFIFWGLLNGLFVVYTTITKKARKDAANKIGLSGFPLINKVVGVACTFLFTVMVWVLFRANNFKEAMLVYRKAFGVFGEFSAVVKNRKYLSKVILHQVNLYTLLYCLCIILLFQIVEYKSRNQAMETYIGKMPQPLRWSAYVLGFVCLYFFGIYQSRQFIYFQF